MIFIKDTNKYDRALIILLIALFSGNMSGILLLPRTCSILLLPLFLRTSKNCAFGLEAKRFFILFAVCATISLSWTSDFENGITELILLLFNLLYAYELIIFAAHSTKPIYLLSVGWFIALSINNVIGIWEIYTDNHLSVSKFGGDHQMMIDGRYVFMRYANGFFSNYNAFVTFTCCSLPFLYYLIFTCSNRLFRMACIFNLLVGVYILFMNASRGGILALAVISTAFLYFLVRKTNSKKNVILFFCFLIAFLVYSWDSISFMIMGRQAQAGDIQDEARWPVWNNAISVLIDTFGFGSGVGGLPEAMRQYKTTSVLAPHNAFLEILSQYGVLVFVSFVIFIYRIWRSSMKHINHYYRTIVYASLLAMPAIFIINSVNLIQPYFWAFISSLFIVSNSYDSRFLRKDLL